jgi:hypothetical protein
VQQSRYVFGELLESAGFLRHRRQLLPIGVQLSDGSELLSASGYELHTEQPVLLEPVQGWQEQQDLPLSRNRV